MDRRVDQELHRLGRVLEVFQEEEDQAVQRRMLQWLAEKLGLERPGKPAKALGLLSEDGPVNLQAFETAAEALAAAVVSSDGERVLLIAAFLQEVKRQEPLTAALINKELRHLGFPVKNITWEIDKLMSRRPALMVQLRKSGTSRQARKTYKATAEGVAYAERLLKGDRAPESEQHL